MPVSFESSAEPAYPPRRVVIVATPTAHSLEVSGPVEVFSMAAMKLREAGRERMAGYAVEVVSTSDDLQIKSSSGLTILAHRSFRQIDYEVDTVLIAGGMDFQSTAYEDDLLDWVRALAGKARRYGSVCTGAFLLAEAGLLDGKRVTTHWYFCQRLQKDYPALIVDPEPIFIRDGSLFTSAGVTSGIDLALSMVEDDFGLDIAMRVARALVLFVRRPSGQNQFSTSLAFQGTSRVPLRELPIYVLENLSEPLKVEHLAARVSMSVRNFGRVFLQEFGVTPAVFVDRLRLETAKRLIEESSRTVDEIAADCGFGGTESMRRGFLREFGVSPAELRRNGLWTPIP